MASLHKWWRAYVERPPSTTSLSSGITSSSREGICREAIEYSSREGICREAYRVDMPFDKRVVEGGTERGCIYPSKSSSLSLSLSTTTATTTTTAYAARQAGARAQEILRDRGEGGDSDLRQTG